jgi:hypothetical protein
MDRADTDVDFEAGAAGVAAATILRKTVNRLESHTRTGILLCGIDELMIWPI